MPVLGILLLFSSQARAEAVAEEAPKVQEIKSVERGFFIETEVGASFLVTKFHDRNYGLAFTTGLYGGYDLLPILNLSVGFTVLAASVSQDNPPQSADDPMLGDLLFLTPMVQVQFAVITTERNFLWLRGNAGFAFGLPNKIGEKDFGGAGPAFGGMVGFERFTKLRHFSIGAHAGVLVLTKPSVGIAVSVMPTLKYTF